MTLTGQRKNDYQNEWMAKRRARGIELLGGRCVECGSTDDLEVDHIEPTSKVSHRIWSWSWARITDELAKCQLLCAPCHLSKTRRWLKLGGHLVKGHPKGCGCRSCSSVRELEAMEAFRRGHEMLREQDAIRAERWSAAPGRYEVFE